MCQKKSAEQVGAKIRYIFKDFGNLETIQYYLVKIQIYLGKFKGLLGMYS